MSRIQLTELILRPPTGLKGARPLTLPSPLKTFPGLEAAVEQALSAALPAAAQRGAGEFTTTFIDRDMRNSRGALGELRIFTRV